MKTKTKKIVLWIIVLAFLIPLFIWVGALVKNLVLTVMHKDEIENLQFIEYEEPFPAFDWYRVISYSDETIEIYFVNTLKSPDREYKIGGTMTLCKTPNGWHHTDLVNSISWSGAGSADHFIWPYWFHIFLA